MLCNKNILLIAALNKINMNNICYFAGEREYTRQRDKAKQKVPVLA